MLNPCQLFVFIVIVEDFQAARAVDNVGFQQNSLAPELEQFGAVGLEQFGALF